MDGPKARHSHSLSAFETSVFLAGGKNGDTEMRDLWKFDFENVQAQGSDLVGVVAEQISADIPVHPNLISAFETSLIALTDSG